MKKIFAALSAAAIMIAGALAVSAEGLIPDEYYEAQEWAPERLKPRVLDDADILSDSEESLLLDKLDRISEEHGVDVVLLTIDSLGNRTPNLYGDDYFAYNGFGQGGEHDGFMLLLSMEDRDWAIVTHGSGIRIFTDYGQDYLMDQIGPELRRDEFYDAFDEYADISEMFIQEWEKGTPFDTDHKVGGGKLPFYWIFIALLGGGLVGLVYSLSVKSQLTSVKMQRGADDYIRQGSFQVTGSRDTFLYSKVTRERIDSGSGGGGGGSSTHSHSSGSSFGGSHGKF